MTEKEKVQAQIDQNNKDQEKLREENDRLSGELKKLHTPKHGDVRWKYGSSDPIIYIGDEWFNDTPGTMRKEPTSFWNSWGKYRYNIFDKIKEIG